MLRRPPRAPVDPALPVLRRRASYLLADQPAKVQAFVRIVPLLLSARFRRPNLEAEPPGLLLPPRRRRWGRLCDRLDLPPPGGWYATAHPLVRSVVLAPRADGSLELIVVPLDGLTLHQERRLGARLDAITWIAARHAPGLELRSSDAANLSPSLFAWAAVIAGEVPGEGLAGPLDRLDVLSRAPSALLRCVALLVPPDAPPPLEVLRTSHVSAQPLPFLAAWSGQPVARDLCALADKHLSATELGGLATQLRTATLRELRRVPLEARRELSALVRPALLGARIPPALREHLERTLRQSKAKEVQREHGWQLELDGLVLVKAASLDQLRARAVAESPRLAKGGPIWPRVATLVGQGLRSRTRALALLEPGFLRHLVVVIPRSGRPVARRVDAPTLIRQLLEWHRSGVSVELLSEAGCDPALLSRAAQLLKLPLEPGGVVAYELEGGRVQLLGDGTSRSLPIDAVLRRPRTLTWLPRRADVARCLRRPLSTGLPTVHAVAVPHDKHVAVFALDAGGALFRERVAPGELAGTLSDWREVLRHTDPPTLVATSVHPQLDALAGLRAERGPAITLEVELVRGGEQVLFDGERFGHGAPLPWSALAEAVLSHWPPGTSTALSIPRVRCLEPVDALWLLAARSRVLRRVNTHLRRIARVLRAA